MEGKGEMGKECGPEDGEKKRPKHQGDLIQEQQKESKEHGGEDLRLRHRFDTNRRNRQTYRCASPRDSLSSTSTCLARCAERSLTLPNNFGGSSAQAVTPMSVVPWSLAPSSMMSTGVTTSPMSIAVFIN